MNKFLKGIVLFGLLFFLFDKLFLPLLYVSPNKEIDKRLELVINGKMNKELIIVGSSRGARNIIASTLEEKTNLSSYNLSYPGSDLEFHEFIVRSLVKYNTPPKILIVCIDNPMAFIPDSILKFRYDRMYPLVKYDWVMDELIEREEKNKWLSKFFVLHKINKSNFDISQKKFNALDTLDNSGSMPITFQKKDENWNINNEQKQYNKSIEMVSKLKAFESIKSICKKKNIQLIIVSPPLFEVFNNGFYKRIKSLLSENIDYYIYNYKNLIYSDKNYYYDKTHLKKNGALEFSNELSIFINQVKIN